MKGVINYAKRKDRLLIFCAGNYNIKDDDSYLPDGVEGKDAWLSNTLFVAATDKDKKDVSNWGKDDSGVMQGSNMGKVVEIAAPGDNISFSPNYDYEHGDGTSYAAPLVTGTAGLIKSINPSLVPPEIKYLVLSTFLCKIIIGQFFKERQIPTHFSHRV